MLNKVWIVDDDSSIRWVLERALSKKNISCELFDNSSDVLAALTKSTPSILISDIRMPGESGLVLLKLVKAKLPELPIIIMTAFSDLDTAVSSFQAGAYEYLSKPFDIDTAVNLIIRTLNDSLSKAEELNSITHSVAPNLLGKSIVMQEVFRAVGRLSQSSTTVLVTGETGTGKELIARALHDSSRRSCSPFIPLNMAAIPRDLLESELFGHEKGAFTGANSMKRGRFEQANGGTLFLDEIGDMNFELQTSLLRVLSDGQFYRVGGVSSINSNVRVITATHQDLESRVEKGLFREDLFHRINVIRLHLPALRERPEDIAILANFFLDKSARDLSVSRKFLSDEAIDSLSKFYFSGNVRQLKNVCHWLTVMGPGNHISKSDLPNEIKTYNPEIDFQTNLHSRNFDNAIARNKQVDGGYLHPNINKTPHWQKLLSQSISKTFNTQLIPANNTSFEHWSKEFETVVYKAALEHTRGKRLAASKLLNVGRNTVTRKIKELDLNF